MTNPLMKLGELGQSPWLDSLSRRLLTSGELARLVEEDGLKGVTSNPSIFDKAIRGSDDYDDWLEELRAQDLPPAAIYERIAVRDIQAAADVLEPVYDETEGADGFVSLEVSPFLANDTERTLSEAHRLWADVDRPNLMIKVPGTEAGLPAIERLVSEGVNVNVTLLFSTAVYERVVEAYLSGLEKRAAAGEGVGRIASVASFFVSRIDVAVDERLETLGGEARSLAGKVAIANAKLAYRIFERRFSGERWEELERKGARKQRLLWASTSTKNPSYPDTLYVEALIGPETVDTLPMATLDAYRDHGDPAPRLTEGVEEARATLARLEGFGISLEAVTDELTRAGVLAFAQSFDSLLNAVDARCDGAAEEGGGGARYALSEGLTQPVAETLEAWTASGNLRRLWEGDASLWTGGDESDWLGWLSLTEDAGERSRELAELSGWVRESGFEHAVVLGMGGSSLFPEVLGETLGPREGFPVLSILDSTDPAQVRALDARCGVDKTLFIVSSKSGTTLEPNIFMDYFFHRVAESLGERAGERFLAVTDPGSKLEEESRRRGFARVFHGIPSVGGRYSALSAFGMVPAAAMGLDVKAFLERAHTMALQCSPCSPPEGNPGARLGAALGVAASTGRDKLTVIASPGIRDLGAWLEQLLAESTGKLGKGIIPVDREIVGPPEVYGDDRLFAYLRLESAPDDAQDEAAEALEAAGHPVVRISLDAVEDLGREIFRWEIATAVAGSIMGIDPFNQPDVEASKVETRKLTEAYERSGRLPDEAAFFEAEGIRLFADDENREALGAGDSLASYLRAHLGRLGAGDYFAILAYVAMNDEHERLIQTFRHAVRNRRRVATCLGFGPRFQHSTGQAYKGGPASGVFLQITCDDAEDLPVPGREVSFGVVKAAQARGDLEVLAQRGRRVLRVHLGADVAEGLKRLERAVAEALA